MKINFQLLFLLTIGILYSTTMNAQKLATLKVSANSTDTEGRAMVSARNHHFVIDAPPPLGGPNEAINPIEILLSSLGSCGVLVAERVAEEMNIPLTESLTVVEADLDPRGVKGEEVNPRIQVFRVKLSMTGPTEEQAEQLVKAIRTRCPIYTTLERAAPIELEVTLNSK